MWAARCAGWSAQTGAESTCPLSLHPRRGLRSRQVAGQRRRYDARRGLVHFIRRLASAVTLRLRGDYLAIVTLGFGEITYLLLINLDRPVNITGGPSGIIGIDPPAVAGFALS